MIEYKLELKAKLSTVKTLWKKFLKDDPMWHFTLEDTYIEIRVSKKMLKLEKYFKDKKWKFIRFVYQDNIPITRKFQKEFEMIFHGYSELAMKSKSDSDFRIAGFDDSERKRLIERCIHLIHNMMDVNGLDEANNVAGYAVGRAYTTGKYLKT